MKILTLAQRGLIISSALWTITSAPGGLQARNVDPHLPGVERPKLEVRIFRLPSVPEGIVKLSAAEAARVFQGVPVTFDWLDCSGPVQAPACQAPLSPKVITIRILPHALPDATEAGLGMTMWSDTGASAALFYDRAMALRRPSVPVQRLLGLAMAHEIVHVLLSRDHTDEGLMVARWSTEYLATGHSGYSGLSRAMEAAIESEARRRVSQPAFTRN